MIGASVIARDIPDKSAPKRRYVKAKSVFAHLLWLTMLPWRYSIRTRSCVSPGIDGKIACLGHARLSGPYRCGIVEGPEGARLTAIKREVLRTGVGTRTETKVICNGEPCYFVLVVEPLRDARGIVQADRRGSPTATANQKSLFCRGELSR